MNEEKKTKRVYDLKIVVKREYDASTDKTVTNISINQPLQKLLQKCVSAVVLENTIEEFGTTNYTRKMIRSDIACMTGYMEKVLYSTDILESRKILISDVDTSLYFDFLRWLRESAKTYFHKVYETLGEKKTIAQYTVTTGQ